MGTRLEEPRVPAGLWRFWADVGGTFTDCLAQSPLGDEFTIKVLSSGATKNGWSGWRERGEFSDPLQSDRPQDFWCGYQIRWLDDRGNCLGEAEVTEFVCGGLFRIADVPAPVRSGNPKSYELVSPEPSPIFAFRQMLGLALHESLPPVSMFLGTTRGTNALLTRRGSRTALVTTLGFGDILEIGEQDRPNLFDVTIRKPRPLYERVIEVDERLGADGSVLRPLDREQVRVALSAAMSAGIESIAICLLHGYCNGIHEQAVADVARELGFQEVSVSSDVSPLIKLVSRSETTVLNAYLNPVIRAYADQIKAALSPGSQLQLMTSGGSLVSRDRFNGKDSVLSGPAGGVVGFARVAEEAGYRRAIGFDMGGTSTDVARYDGVLEKEFETRKAGVRIVAPMLAIETVAAGGGSICDFVGGRLTVGPESASSDPGPACYGRGGPLAVTDINVFLGRVSESQFPFPLSREAVERRLDELIARVRLACGQEMTRVQLAQGLMDIANQNMASAIRTVSVARGYDPNDYLLVAFGGAGPQHATAVADRLGMTEVLVHPHSSVLSAVGIRLADRTSFAVQSILKPWQESLAMDLRGKYQALEMQAQAELLGDGLQADQMEFLRSIDLRYQGTEPYLNVPASDLSAIQSAFDAQHLRLFGYLQQRPVEVVALRVEAVVRGPRLPKSGASPRCPVGLPQGEQRLFSQGQMIAVPRYDWTELKAGNFVTGPALIADRLTTTVVDQGWTAEVLVAGQLLLRRLPESDAMSSERNHGGPGRTTTPDPVRLEIFNNHFASIAKQMGITLQRTSVSVNVKDRLDFSCALFDAAGNLVVNAPHIPVHLGSMSETVRHLIRSNPEIVDGDVLITNDPYAGGSHLPDVTVVTPVFLDQELAFWLASRSHHAEIGGKTPGSMPPNATCLGDEGVLIRDLKLIAAGVEHFGELEALLLAGPYPTRNVNDNLADVRAQVAANRSGAQALLALAGQYSLPVVQAYMGFVQDAAESQVRAALRAIPDGDYSFRDQMDNGKVIVVSIRKDTDRLVIDFTGTDSVSNDNLNANRAICLAAIMYTMRCLLRSEIPLNEGVMRPVELILPECFLNPRPDAEPAKSPAIVGGNVETSQRIVDVLWGALGLAAASQGTMNNWLMGDAQFGYYETLGGGSGATSEGPGADAVHCHMSNTRLTDPEVLESRYPVRLVEFGIERGTGGWGHHAGGCGMRRCIEFLKPLTVSLLTSRRNTRPYGMQGGNPGASGRNLLSRAGSSIIEELPSRLQIEVGPGDQLTLVTPGGGGWGTSQSIV